MLIKERYPYNGHNPKMKIGTIILLNFMLHRRGVVYYVYDAAIPIPTLSNEYFIL